MESFSIFIAALLALSSAVSGQLLGGSLEGLTFDGANMLCDQTLDDANTTGVYSWNPHVAQFSQVDQPDNDSSMTLPVLWLVTVDEISGSDNASVRMNSRKGVSSPMLLRMLIFLHWYYRCSGRSGIRRMAL